MSGPTSLYTCRYWAFGSGCPNILHGKNICEGQFAHWDSGRLASEFDQRGTCKFWLQGNCVKGNACFYEHRNTGIEGLYQGRVTLNGFNLDIAVAASKAGFDTHNHSCLFDLIWAVKRIALRASKGAVVDRPPPRDPVYPDRFRPSGIGDNTKRKRPPPQFAPPQATPVKLETIIKPAQTNQRQFRYRNKKAPSRAKQVPVSKLSGYSTRGTQENPVELLSDSDEPVGVKRQKLNAAAFSKPRPSANTSQARAAPERLLGDGDMLTPQPEIVTQDTMQVDGHTYVRTSAQYNDDLDGGQLHLLQVDLQKVKDELKATVSNLKWCNDSMSTAFETYRDVMARRDVHSSLGRLSENFETARTSALQGIGHLNDILDILG